MVNGILGMGSFCFRGLQICAALRAASCEQGMHAVFRFTGILLWEVGPWLKSNLAFASSGGAQVTTLQRLQIISMINSGHMDRKKVGLYSCTVLMLLSSGSSVQAQDPAPEGNHARRILDTRRSITLLSHRAIAIMSLAKLFGSPDIELTDSAYSYGQTWQTWEWSMEASYKTLPGRI